MGKEINIQQENVNKLIELMKENTSLRVVPMVDHDVIGEEGYNWWMGVFGEAEIDYIWTDNERVYFKSIDEEELADEFIEKMGNRGLDLDDDEIIDIAEKEVDELEWEKVIVVQIDVAC